MKTLGFLLALMLFATVTNATIYTVNNQDGYDADYTTIPNAITAASPGDTIYVQPSIASYGDINITKQLFIIGAGHNAEFSNYPCQIGVVTFQNGSTGSIVKGLNIWYVSTSNFHTANNIVISGCYIWAQNPFSMNAGTFNDWILEGNIIVSQSNSTSFNSAGPGWIIRNNIFNTFAGGTIVSYIPSGTVFENNIMMCTANSSFQYAFSAANNVTVRNNIFYITTTTVSPIESGCNSCTWENNSTYHPNLTFPALPGTGNLDNTNPDFVDVPLLDPAFAYDKDFHLNPGSLLIGAGVGGTDIGLYGGIFPFRPEGFDNTLPRIKTITPLMSTAPPGGSLQINLKAAAAGH